MLELILSSTIGKLIIAYAMGFAIGWDREAAARSAGLRTFPLVSSASCVFVLIGVQSFGGETEPIARLIYGLMTGIGFIGGGTIFKSDNHVSGTATAASIWCTGAIGATVALGQYDLAVSLTLISLLTLRLVTPLKAKLADKPKEE